MKNTLRIMLSIVVLIGGTLGFAYWARMSFDKAFADLGATGAYNASAIQAVRTSSTPVAPTVPQTPPITVTPPETKTLTPATQAEAKIIKLGFSFPSASTTVYRGCKYTIAWNTTSVASMDMTLMDAGTRKPMGPVASGIAKNVTPKGTTLPWKVGTVWPGSYYILASNINGSTLSEKSPVFTISDESVDPTTGKQCAK